MTTRHVERLIDFNHEMMEPLQFHIDEDIHYKKEDVGIRAAGYLYLSGKYKAEEGIRLFQELLEVDILAPFDKIFDESTFRVHVKDYDYSVRDGDLLIDICIDIEGIDDQRVSVPMEDERSQLENEYTLEDMEDQLDEIDINVDNLIPNDLDQNLDAMMRSMETNLTKMDHILTHDSFMGLEDPEVVPILENKQEEVPMMETPEGMDFLATEHEVDVTEDIKKMKHIPRVDGYGDAEQILEESFAMPVIGIAAEDILDRPMESGETTDGLSSSQDGLGDSTISSDQPINPNMQGKSAQGFDPFAPQTDDLFDFQEFMRELTENAAGDTEKLTKDQQSQLNIPFEINASGLLHDVMESPLVNVLLNPVVMGTIAKALGQDNDQEYASVIDIVPSNQPESISVSASSRYEDLDDDIAPNLEYDCDCDKSMSLDTYFERNYFLDVEDDPRNYVTSKRLTELIHSREIDDMREPIRIVFDLLTEDETVPVMASLNISEPAHQAWLDHLNQVQSSVQTNANQAKKPTTPTLPQTPATKPESVAVSTSGGDKVIVDRNLIEEMNEFIVPKENLYYGASHPRKPKKEDVSFGRSCSLDDDFGNAPKLPNLNVPFDQEKTLMPNVKGKKERKRGEVKQVENEMQKDVLDDMPELSQDIEGLMEGLLEMASSEESIEDLSVAATQKNNSVLEDKKEQPSVSVERKNCPQSTSRDETPVETRKISEATTKNQSKTTNRRTSAKKSEDNVLLDEEDLVVSGESIESLFEDAENKVASIRIVIARPNDSYESIGNRYNVNEMKLAQHNHQKPIHERTLVIIPLD